MANVSSNQPIVSTPGTDPGRMATIGFLLIAVIWLGYCALMMPPPKETDPAGDTPPGGDEVVDDGRDDADPPEAGPQTGADGGETVDSPADSGPGGDATQTQPGTNAEVQTQPDSAGPELVTPGQSESDDPGSRQAERSAVGRAEMKGVGRLPDGTPFDPADSLLIAGEEVRTPKLWPVFTNHGAAIAELRLPGYPGVNGRDFTNEDNVSENIRLLAAYNPDALSYASGPALPLKDLDPDYLANVKWEFLGATTTEPESEGTAKETVVSFRFPPADAEWADDVPVEVIKRFRYAHDSYLIRVAFELTNRTTSELEIRPRLHGAIGMNTGYVPPDPWQETLVARMDRTQSIDRVFLPGPNQAAPAAETLADEERPEVQVSSLLPEGYERYDRLPRIQAMGVAFGTRREQPRAIHWSGRNINYFKSIVFSTPAHEGETQQVDAILTRAQFSIFQDVEHPLLTGEAGELAQTQTAVPENRWRIQEHYRFAPFRLAAGGTADFAVKAFIGPKEPEALEAAGLGEMVQYSYQIFEWIAEPLLGLMNFYHGIVADIGIPGAWGFAIILLTLTVRIVLMPISYTSQYKMQESSTAMRLLQPKIEKLKKKYADNKQKLQQEQMKLFREEGVPLGGMFQGCLLMLLQMPIWIALFGLFRYSIDFYGAEFLWMDDLSKPDALIVFGEGRAWDLPFVGDAFGMFGRMLTPMGIWQLNILPIIVMLTMWYQMSSQQKLSAATMTDEQKQQQKIMMGCMFFMFFFLFYPMAAGFNLYFGASTAYALLESRLIKPRVQARIEAKYPQAKLLAQKAEREKAEKAEKALPKPNTR
jgi:YidC/Oxa1 family membrane protein insertase